MLPVHYSCAAPNQNGANAVGVEKLNVFRGFSLSRCTTVTPTRTPPTHRHQSHHNHQPPRPHLPLPWLHLGAQFPTTRVMLPSTVKRSKVYPLEAGSPVVAGKPPRPCMLHPEVVAGPTAAHPLLLLLVHLPLRWRQRRFSGVEWHASFPSSSRPGSEMFGEWGGVGASEQQTNYHAIGVSDHPDIYAHRSTCRDKSNKTCTESTSSRHGSVRVMRRRYCTNFSDAGEGNVQVSDLHRYKNMRKTGG